MKSTVTFGAWTLTFEQEVTYAYTDRALPALRGGSCPRVAAISGPGMVGPSIFPKRFVGATRYDLAHVDGRRFDLGPSIRIEADEAGNMVAWAERMAATAQRVA